MLQLNFAERTLCASCALPVHPRSGSIEYKESSKLIRCMVSGVCGMPEPEVPIFRGLSWAHGHIERPIFGCMGANRSSWPPHWTKGWEGKTRTCHVQLEWCTAVTSFVQTALPLGWMSDLWILPSGTTCKRMRCGPPSASLTRMAMASVPDSCTSREGGRLFHCAINMAAIRHLDIPAFSYKPHMTKQFNSASAPLVCDTADGIL